MIILIIWFKLNRSSNSLNLNICLFASSDSHYVIWKENFGRMMILANMLRRQNFCHAKNHLPWIERHVLKNTLRHVSRVFELRIFTFLVHIFQKVKNQTKRWYKIGSPSPTGSEKRVLKFRSNNNIAIAPANTGKSKVNETTVTQTDHEKWINLITNLKKNFSITIKFNYPKTCILKTKNWEPLRWKLPRIARDIQTNLLSTDPIFRDWPRKST